MLETVAGKLYRGTWDEILRHQSDIPLGAAVELKFLEIDNIDQGDFGGLSFAEAFKDLIGTVNAGPPDMAANPSKHLTGFGEIKTPPS